MKKLESKREEIVKKYNAGVTQQELADEYGVSRMTISDIIHEYYGHPRASSYIRKRNFKLPIEKIAKEYEAGNTQQELADEYGISRHTVSRHLLKYYNETGKLNPERKNFIRFKDLPIEEIAKKYEQRISQNKLAEEYCVTRRTIGRKLKKYYEEIGEPMPYIKPKSDIKSKKGIVFINIPIEEIVKKYEAGLTRTNIAQEYGVSEITISNRINEYYTKKGIEKPRILKNVTTIVDYLNKGLTIEQIKEIAGKKNIIIPQSIIDTALDKTKNKNLTDDDNAR